MESEETVASKEPRKIKSGFLKSVSSWLIGSSKSKFKDKEENVEKTENVIPYEKDPKLTDTDKVKTISKEYDRSTKVLTSEQIKAKLEAVDRYYNPEGPPPKKEYEGETDKERPSWGYIVERPIVEQYVLMNNYIRRASVLAELKEIEEEEKTGQKNQESQFETETEITLPSDYENDLNHFKQHQLQNESYEFDKKKRKSLKETIKQIILDSKNEDNQYSTSTVASKSKSTVGSRASSSKRSFFAKKSDEDLPITYKDYKPEMKLKRSFRKFEKELSEPSKDYDIIDEVSVEPSRPSMPSTSAKSRSSISSTSKQSISKQESEALELFNEQKNLLRKVSSPYVADRSDSDDSEDFEPRRREQRSVSFAENLRVYQYFRREKEDEEEEEEEEDYQKEEENAEENVLTKRLDKIPLEEFKPKNFMKPEDVVRKQTEKNETISPETSFEKRKSWFSRKSFQKESSPEKINFTSLIKNFNKFEPIQTESNKSSESLNISKSENLDNDKTAERGIKIEIEQSLDSIKAEIVKRRNTQDSTSEEEREVIRTSLLLDRPDAALIWKTKNRNEDSPFYQRRSHSLDVWPDDNEGELLHHERFRRTRSSLNVFEEAEDRIVYVESNYSPAGAEEIYVEKTWRPNIVERTQAIFEQSFAEEQRREERRRFSKHPYVEMIPERSRRNYSVAIEERRQELNPRDVRFKSIPKEERRNIFHYE